VLIGADIAELCTRMFLFKKSAALITASDVVFEGGKITHELFDCAILAGKEEVDKTPRLSLANAWKFRKNLDKSFNRIHIRIKV
jgi:hypothetical protein